MILSNEIAGPLKVDMAAERGRSDADPNKPSFLNGITFDANHPEQWQEIVLPHVEKLTFVVASSSDMHFAGAMLKSEQLPQLYLAVRKLELPGFYWFSGVQHNRLHNPNVQMAQHLGNLRELTFKMHTAGITTSAFGERQMIQLEREGLERSKERRCLRLADVVAKYELDGLFECRCLRRICIQYIECEMTRHFCRVGNPVNILQGLQTRLIQGFARQGQQVMVELVRAPF